MACCDKVLPTFPNHNGRHITHSAGRSHLTQLINVLHHETILNNVVAELVTVACQHLN